MKNRGRDADVAVLVDLLIAVVEHADVSVGAHRAAVYAALHRAYPVMDRLSGYPPQDPSPTLTLVHDIVYGGADQARLCRVVNGW